jgi:hypothetical protein
MAAQVSGRETLAAAAAEPRGPSGGRRWGRVCEPVARGLEPATAGAPREPGFLALLDAARGQVSATRGIMFVVLKGNGMGEP